MNSDLLKLERIVVILMLTNLGEPLSDVDLHCFNLGLVLGRIMTYINTGS